MALFPEEKNVQEELLEEWYEGVRNVSKVANDIFFVKGKMYDRKSPPWERIEWPHGFQQLISMKANRVKQMLDGFDAHEPSALDWAEINEELIDINNYSRMLVSLNDMMLARDFEYTLHDVMDQAAAESMTPRDKVRMELIIGTQPEGGE